MLVLSRKVGEKIRISDDIVVTVIEIRGDKVRLGFDAPTIIRIHREEIYQRLLNEEIDKHEATKTI